MGDSLAVALHHYDEVTEDELLWPAARLGDEPAGEVVPFPRRRTG
jgi:hypothetical protein